MVHKSSEMEMIYSVVLLGETSGVKSSMEITPEAFDQVNVLGASP